MFFHAKRELLYFRVVLPKNPSEESCTHGRAVLFRGESVLKGSISAGCCCVESSLDCAVLDHLCYFLRREKDENGNVLIYTFHLCENGLLTIGQKASK